MAVAAADRYVRALSQVPGVVTERQGRRRVVRFEIGDAVPRPSHAAAVAACWAAGIADIFSGSEYEQGVRDALEYVAGRAKQSGDFTHVGRKFVFVSRGGESSLPESAMRLTSLVDAVLRCQIVLVDYVHFNGSEETLRLRPLSMAIYDHQIYLIGIGPKGSPYPFRLSRIRSVKMTDEAFDYPPRASYDPKQIFRDSFGIFISDTYPVARVRIRLPIRWRTHCLTHKWHASQRVQDTDAGIVVTLVVRVCPELEAWVLGFAGDAEVLEPPEFARQIKTAIARMSTSRRPPHRASHSPPKKTARGRAR
jgi:predicted DNA-binding transcriptional regulator YafY